tara:strand:- start:4873 stop:5238 length:366 start_codon:yes stop_codon:yes gene_type:complete
MTYEEAVTLLEGTLSLEAKPDVGPQDLRDELQSPDAYIWTGERSCVLVRVRDCTTGERVCDASPAAGDMNEILERATSEIEDFARLNRCTQIHIRAGRPGWERAFKPHGYERSAVILRKLL